MPFSMTIVSLLAGKGNSAAVSPSKDGDFRYFGVLQTGVTILGMTMELTPPQVGIYPLQLWFYNTCVYIYILYPRNFHL